MLIGGLSHVKMVLYKIGAFPYPEMLINYIINDKMTRHACYVLNGRKGQTVHCYPGAVVIEHSTGVLRQNQVKLLFH